MSRDFQNVTGSDYVDVGLEKLLARDLATLTGMSGTGSFSTQISNLIYTDLSTKKIYNVNNGVSTELIDFNPGNTYITTDQLAAGYQPLNSSLTAFAGVSVSQQGAIAYNALVPISNFFNNNFIMTDASTVRTSIGLGSIAQKSVVWNLDITDQSVTLAKLQTPIPTDSQFVCGDIAYSYKSGNREGFLQLQDGATVGNSVSGATYKSSEYSVLFGKLWADLSNKIYTSTGSETTRGVSATADFNNNCRIALPRKLGKFNDVPGTWYEATPNNSYTFTAPRSGYYYIQIVGGGGGTGHGSTKKRVNTLYLSDTFYTSYHTSSSGGAGFAGVLYLEPATYTLKAGASSPGGNGGIAGEPSILIKTGEGTTDLIYASGGNCSTGTIKYVGARFNWDTLSVATGGVLTLSNQLSVVRSDISSNGADGNSALYNDTNSHTAPAVESVLSSLGITNGGVPTYTYSFSGENYYENLYGYEGLAKIQYLGNSADLTKETNIYNFLNGMNAYIKY